MRADLCTPEMWNKLEKAYDENPIRHYLVWDTEHALHEEGSWTVLDRHAYQKLKRQAFNFERQYVTITMLSQYDNTPDPMSNREKVMSRIRQQIIRESWTPEQERRRRGIHFEETIDPPEPIFIKLADRLACKMAEEDRQEQSESRLDKEVPWTSGLI